MSTDTEHKAAARKARRRSNVPAYAAGATLAMLLAMTIGTAVAIRSIMASQSASQFEEFAGSLATTIETDIHLSFAELNAVESFVVGSTDVTATSFEAFISKLSSDGAHAQAFAYAPLITRYDLDDFNQMMRLAGRQDYDLSNTGYRPEYLPIAFSSPVVPGLASPGTDLLSDSRYRSAVVEARRTRQAVASTPRIVSSSDASLLVFHPIEALAPEASTSSRGPVIGIAASIYRVNEFISASPAWGRLDSITYRLIDRTDGGSVVEIFPQAGGDSTAGWRDGKEVAVPVEFAGRNWELQLLSPPEYGLSDVERATWWIVLAAGLALTLFATVSTYSLLKSRQAANTDLRLISSQFRVILDSALEAILLVDENRRVVWANHAFADAFGFHDPSSLSGLDWTDMLAKQSVDLDDQDAYIRRVEAICARQEMTVASEDVRIKAPHRRILSMTSAPVVDEESGYLGRLWVYRDVTAERDAERTKTEFVSMVSHELRTPLTSLTGFVELVLDGAGGEVGDEGRRMLNIAKTNGDRLTRLVSDVLDISRLESGRFELVPEFIFLGDLLRDLSESMESEFERKDISYRLDVEPGLPRIWADRERTAQVVSNLLTNAYRYTEPGGSVSVDARHDGTNVVVTVSDTGVGIAREDQGRVFDKFVRLRDRRQAPKGSTGLGLAISKSLVELQGGSIRLESESGRGSSFIVALPIKPPNEFPEAA